MPDSLPAIPPGDDDGVQAERDEAEWIGEASIPRRLPGRRDDDGSDGPECRDDYQPREKKDRPVEAPREAAASGGVGLDPAIESQPEDQVAGAAQSIHLQRECRRLAEVLEFGVLE